MDELAGRPGADSNGKIVSTHTECILCGNKIVRNGGEDGSEDFQGSY